MGDGEGLCMAYVLACGDADSLSERALDSSYAHTRCHSCHMPAYLLGYCL